MIHKYNPRYIKTIAVTYLLRSLLKAQISQVISLSMLRGLKLLFNEENCYVTDFPFILHHHTNYTEFSSYIQLGHYSYYFFKNVVFGPPSLVYSICFVVLINFNTLLMTDFFTLYPFRN